MLDRPVKSSQGAKPKALRWLERYCRKPQLLLLDEPLAALDIGFKERILPYFGRVRDEFEIPMIYVTHNLTEVLSLADWALMIQQGKLVTQGIPKEAFRSTHAIFQIPEERFENVFTVSFIGSDPCAGTDQSPPANRQGIIIPYMQNPANNSSRFASVPTTLSSRPRGPSISASNVVPGIVRSIDSLDGQAMLTVFAGEEFYVRITAAAVTRLGLIEDGRVFLIMKTRSFHLL